MSQWCCLTILSSAAHFFCLQSFPAAESFLMSWLFASGGQNIGTSASVLPKNIQGWFPLGLMAWSPCSPMDSQESSPAPQFKSINTLVLSLLYGPTLPSVWDNFWLYGPLSAKWSLCFNAPSRFVVAFLPRSKHLLISWLQSPSAVILKLKKIKSVTVSPSICHAVMVPDAMILVFWMLSFKPTFFTLCFHLLHQEAF